MKWSDMPDTTDLSALYTFLQRQDFTGAVDSVKVYDYCVCSVLRELSGDAPAHVPLALFWRRVAQLYRSTAPAEVGYPSRDEVAAWISKRHCLSSDIDACFYGAPNDHRW